MKTVYQLGFLLTAGGLFVAGIRYDNLYAIVVALTLAYLLVALLQSRFIDSRTKLIHEGARSSGMVVDNNSVYYPFSNEDGVYILKNEESFRAVSLNGLTYHIKKLVSYPVKHRGVKKYELERKYLEYVYVSRFALVLTSLMAMGLAGFYAYTEHEYGYLFIPIGAIVYHFFWYFRIFDSATEISLARVANRDLEYLDDLMRFYGVAIIGLEDPNPIIEVLQTGAVAVRYEDSLEAPYYFITFEERLYLEDLAEELTAPLDEKQHENSSSSI